MEQVIELTEDMFINKGTQKAVYAYPGDSTKCIKVKIIEKNADMIKELRYRTALKKRRQHKDMLPEYYGCVKTNLGDGHIFELIKNFDGQNSKEIEDYLKQPDLAKLELHTDVMQILKEFKQAYLKEAIICSDVSPRNFLVQRLSEDKYRFCVVDNIGTPCKFPLAYWFDYFANKRAKKYWKRFVRETQERYPEYGIEKLL